MAKKKDAGVPRPTQPRFKKGMTVTVVAFVDENGMQWVSAKDHYGQSGTLIQAYAQYLGKSTSLDPAAHCMELIELALKEMRDHALLSGEGDEKQWESDCCGTTMTQSLSMETGPHGDVCDKCGKFCTPVPATPPTSQVDQGVTMSRCDYRNAACVNKGKMVNGVWICDNHLAALSISRMHRHSTGFKLVQDVDPNPSHPHE